MKGLMGSLALALAVSAASYSWAPDIITTSTGGDPFKPKRRSKGEKARNRKNRGGRP